MVISALFDLCVASIFISIMAYIFFINRRVSFIWKNRREFQKFLEDFVKISQVYQAKLVKLQKEVARLHDMIDEKLVKSDTVASDLSFLVDRAERLAAQLEDSISRDQSGGLPSTEGPKKGDRAMISSKNVQSVVGL